jgi:hypothetical protein
LFRERAQLEWLGTSHMSVLGPCWVQAYFEKEGYFECMPNFGEEQLAGKATCKRISMKCKKEGKPNHERVMVFDNDCNGYKPVK